MSRSRSTLIGALAVAAVGVPVALAWPAQAATTVVTSISALQKAIAGATSGTVVELADGSYSTSSAIEIGKSGVTVRAQHVGGATLSGSGGFTIDAGVSDVVVSGFRLTGSRGLSIP